MRGKVRIMIDIEYLMGIVALLLGGTLLLVKMVFSIQGGAKEKGLIAVIIGTCILSLAHYIGFGAFHQLPKYGPQNFHQEEVFHYYIGSKYFKETGYYDLYNYTSIYPQ